MERVCGVCPMDVACPAMKFLPVLDSPASPPPHLNPLNVPVLHRQVRNVIEGAERFIVRIPSDHAAWFLRMAADPYNLMSPTCETHSAPVHGRACSHPLPILQAPCWKVTKP